MAIGLRPGDHVLTPTGRCARVERVLPDQRVELAYTSGVPGQVSLPWHLRRLVSIAGAARVSYRT